MASQPGGALDVGLPLATEELEVGSVVALGGGHGLSVSLRALVSLAKHVTAVVGVVDDGGSSGRLRDELGVIPPGDLRMALAALCGEDDWARTWTRVMQHRFGGGGPLGGHAVGNLVMSALWEETRSVVVGLDWMGQLLHARGRVLPSSTVPLRLAATVAGAQGGNGKPIAEVRGQAHVAKAGGQVIDSWIEPADAPACSEAVDAIVDADMVVLGPGSWYTSVLPHFQVPGIRDAIASAVGHRVLVLNLDAEPGETPDFRSADYVGVLARRFPDVRIDTVLADERATSDSPELVEACDSIGAELVVERVAAGRPNGRASLVHDPDLLAGALARIPIVTVSPHGDDG